MLRMATVFKAKLRKLGNSLAVIVPNQIVKETGTREGDEVKVLLAISLSKRRSALEKFVGKNIGAKPFTRDERDRI